MQKRGRRRRRRGGFWGCRGEGEEEGFGDVEEREKRRRM